MEKRKYKVVVKISGLRVILSVFKSFKEPLHLAKKAQRASPEVFQTLIYSANDYRGPNISLTLPEVL